MEINSMDWDRLKGVVLSQLQIPKLKSPFLISRRPIKLPQQRLPKY